MILAQIGVKFLLTHGPTHSTLLSNPFHSLDTTGALSMLSPSAYSLTFDSSAPITSAGRVTSPASDVWASLPSPSPEGDLRLAGLRLTHGQEHAGVDAAARDFPCR